MRSERPELRRRNVMSRDPKRSIDEPFDGLSPDREPVFADRPDAHAVEWLRGVYGASRLAG